MRTYSKSVRVVTGGEGKLAKLVERTKAGDMDAFGSLYRETNRRVYFICLHFMKERQETEDMMQEAYLAAFKGLKELREPERFRGWVEQIAVNRCCSIISTILR